MWRLIRCTYSFIHHICFLHYCWPRHLRSSSSVPVPQSCSIIIPCPIHTIGYIHYSELLSNYYSQRRYLSDRMLIWHYFRSSVYHLALGKNLMVKNTSTNMSATKSTTPQVINVVPQDLALWRSRRVRSFRRRSKLLATSSCASFSTYTRHCYEYRLNPQFQAYEGSYLVILF